MARPINYLERSRIQNEAFSLLSKKGFNKTSLSDIANEAKISKSLVQYYYPKKEQLISEFVDLSLNYVYKLIKEDSTLHFASEFDMIYGVGYAQFYFIMYNPLASKFALDILRDRENTTIVVDNTVNWIHQKAKDLLSQSKLSLLEETNLFTFTVGGAFEYLYKALKNKEEINTDFISRMAMSLVGPELQLITDEPLNNMDVRHLFSDSWLNENIKKYNKFVFKII